MALAFTRLELSAEELRGEARRAQDGDQACRLVALALVLEGASRTAELHGGALRFRNIKPRGAAFSMILPAAEGRSV